MTLRPARQRAVSDTMHDLDCAPFILIRKMLNDLRMSYRCTHVLRKPSPCLVMFSQRVMSPSR